MIEPHLYGGFEGGLNTNSNIFINVQNISMKQIFIIYKYLCSFNTLMEFLLRIEFKLEATCVFFFST